MAKKKKRTLVGLTNTNPNMPKLPVLKAEVTEEPSKKKGPTQTPATQGSRSQQKKKAGRKAIKKRKPSDWILNLAVNHRDWQIERINKHPNIRQLLELYSLEVSPVDPMFNDPGPWAFEAWLKRCEDFFESKKKELPAELQRIKHDFIMIILFDSNNRRDWQ